jgi:hypothetical protein
MCLYTPNKMGRHSVVGVAIRYGLVRGSIPGEGGRDFPHSSLLSLGPTQPSVQWVPGLFFGNKMAEV